MTLLYRRWIKVKLISFSTLNCWLKTFQIQLEKNTCILSLLSPFFFLHFHLYLDSANHSFPIIVSFHANDIWTIWMKFLVHLLLVSCFGVLLFIPYFKSFFTINASIHKKVSITSIYLHCNGNHWTGKTIQLEME